MFDYRKFDEIHRDKSVQEFQEIEVNLDFLEWWIMEFHDPPLLVTPIQEKFFSPPPAKSLGTSVECAQNKMAAFADDGSFKDFL